MGPATRLQIDARDLDTGCTLRLARLPLLNATLNGSAALLLAAGFAFVRNGLVRAHVACMVAALTVSAAFLASYLYYHAYAGDMPYTGTGVLRSVYFVILISHVFLAVVTVPLVLLTVYQAVRGQFARHRRLARWALPIWFYVSVTGLLVYLFLYQFSPH